VNRHQNVERKLVVLLVNRALVRHVDPAVSKAMSSHCLPAEESEEGSGFSDEVGGQSENF
jgi:hypothetical protein